MNKFSGQGGGWYKSPSKLTLNFIAMSVSFSLNHGTVTALVAVSTTDLGKRVGNTQLGVLYVLYTLSALLVAAPLVKLTGPKWGLASGLGLYCPYVASFLIAALVSSSKWEAAIIGSAIGGFAAGWLWTAQGSFFSRTCQLYAKATGTSPTEATAKLAGWFSTLYVGLEVLCKLLSSALQKQHNGKVVVFTSFTVLACVSAAAMIFVKDPPELKDEEAEDDDAINDGNDDGEEGAPLLKSRATVDNTPWYNKLTLAINLLVKSRKMQCLSSLNLTFGLTSALVNGYINGSIAKEAIGGSNVGYISAVLPATAAILSIPYGYIGNRIGKEPIMLFGIVNYLILAVVILSVSFDSFVDLRWGLVFVYILAGSGRAVFEGTNKAVFADFFPNDKEAAFANVIIQSGGSAAIAFFVFPYMSKEAKGIVCAVVALFSMFGIMASFSINRKDKARREAQLSDKKAPY